MDIIFFFILTIFFIYKLKNTLGTRNDDDEKRKQAVENFLRQINNQNIVDLNSFTYKTNNVNKNNIDKLDITFQTTDDIKSKLLKINFNEKNFLIGVESAIEMVNEAFSNKDLITLQKLLSQNVYNNFKKQIDILTEQNKFLKTSLISIKEKNIKEILSVSNMIKISVYVEMEQINFIENEKHEVIFGSKKKIENMKEIWTFERDINSKENFWIIDNINSI